MDSGFDTKALFLRALKLQDLITLILNTYTHSKSACLALSLKVSKSGAYIDILIESFQKNREYFQSLNYYSIFTNYLKVLESIIKFLEAFQAKGMFLRFIKKDMYRKSLFLMCQEVEKALGALKHGLSLQVEWDDNGEVKALEVANKVLDSSLLMFGDLITNIKGSEGQRKELVGQLNELENVDENGDLVKSVELPSRQIKSISNDQGREGRFFTVHKRNYKLNVIAEKVYRGSVEDPRLLNQIAKQITILKKLELCPHILKFYGIHRRTNAFGLVTEYAELGSLKEVIAVGGLKEQVKIKMSFQMVEAVAFLHSLNILHKNIKTSSFMVNSNYKVKLSGFEFSREIGAATIQVLDLGSDRYRWLSPEKLRPKLGDQLSTMEGDIYSLTLSLWSLWADSYPYSNMKCRPEIEEFIIKGYRDSLDKVPEFVRPIIESGLSHQPENRPTADELIDLLDQNLPRTDSACTSTTDLSCGFRKSDGIVFEHSIYESSTMPQKHFSCENDDDAVPELTERISLLKVGAEHPVTKDRSDTKLTISTSYDTSTLNRANAIAHPTIFKPRTNQKNVYLKPNSCALSGSDQRTSNLSISTEITMGSSVNLTARNSSNSNISQLGNLKRLSTNKDSDIEVDGDSGIEIGPSGSSITSSMKSSNSLKSSPETDPYSTAEFKISTNSPASMTLESAVHLHNTKNFTQAFHQFYHLHTQSLPRASYFIGYYYFWGHCLVAPQSYTKAHHYLSIAAQSYDSDAFDLLGLIYKENDYPGKDEQKAFKCFERSAGLGNRKGYYHLFATYASGAGVKRDIEKAKYMVKISAQMGYQPAIEQAHKAGIIF